jgi:hypothetical protein
MDLQPALANRSHLAQHRDEALLVNLLKQQHLRAAHTGLNGFRPHVHLF